ncbi:hypothetical protein NDU88_005515 [Pleurodeles waltl]|uniref:Uncharacterized protein n=1 Tax=Pleurodeles waltl TaxID=8319 RepID=A0AAV7TXC2_PLEWA|nr:hypothetical protein NDU88_005515 [Pleurodeles waltl]
MCPPIIGSTRRLPPSFEEGEASGGRLRHWDRATLELRRVCRGAAWIPLRGNPGRVSASKIPGRNTQEPGRAVMRTKQATAGKEAVEAVEHAGGSARQSEGLQPPPFFSSNPFKRKDEDIASYVASLRGLGLSCEFDHLLDSLIRDQLVRCTSDKRIREKLLMRDPNLEEAIQIAKRMEHAAVWLQEMDVKSTQAEQGIVAEIKRKEEPRGAVRWNKFDKDDDGFYRVRSLELRESQLHRVIRVYCVCILGVVGCLYLLGLLGVDISLSEEE